METLVIKLDDGMTMLHFERAGVYPPAGYAGTLADFVVYLTQIHTAGVRTASGYGLIDSGDLQTWLTAGGDRSTITIDGDHNVHLP